MSSPSYFFLLVFESFEEIRTLAEATLRERHPEASEREIFLRFARVNLGNDLFLRAYGDLLPPVEFPEIEIESLLQEVTRRTIERLVAAEHA